MGSASKDTSLVLEKLSMRWQPCTPGTLFPGDIPVIARLMSVLTCRYARKPVLSFAGWHLVHALVFAGGESVAVARIRQIADFDLVIAADSGADLATAAGVDIDLLVGDMDSISPESLNALTDSDTFIEAHTAKKDATDLELALRAATARQATRVTVIGGGGARLDHLLGNVAVITSREFASLGIRWITDGAVAYPVHDDRSITTTPGTTVSVLAIGGDATGVSLDGLEWPLHRATLSASSSLGISNVTTHGEFRAQVGEGSLLVVVNE